MHFHEYNRREKKLEAIEVIVNNSKFFLVFLSVSAFIH